MYHIYVLELSISRIISLDSRTVSTLLYFFVFHLPVLNQEFSLPSGAPTLLTIYQIKYFNMNYKGTTEYSILIF
jgi:hypothetical protein